MEKPIVSICVPAYRAERYISETLESVRGQSFTAWELIVTEDGSRDRTEAIVDSFSRTVAQKVRYVRQEINLGLPATRNAGITLADAEWIALLDSDDLWTVDHLESLVRATQTTPEAELVHSGSILFQSETGRDIDIRAPSPELRAVFPLSLFDARYIIQPASVLLRKALWLRVGGFNPAFRYVEDREMWLRCVRSGAVVKYSGSNTCRYRKHSGALSNHAAEMAEASAAVFDQHLDWEAIPEDVRLRSSAEMWASAGKLRQRSEPRIAARHFRRACSIQFKWDWRVRSLILNLVSYGRRKTNAL